MLVINENSYCTVAEADEYVNSHFLDDDEYRVKWSGLSVENKEVCLIRSTQALDNLKYIGRKKGAQKLQFPRILNLGTFGIVPVLYTSQYYDNGLIRNSGPLGDEDGMEAIKKATIENAVAGAVLNNIVQSTRIANIQGLTAMRAGNVSKTYNRNNKSTINSENDIFTDKIYSILVDWLQSSRYSI